MAEQSPFPEDALEANKAGSLSDAQRAALRSMSWDSRKGGLTFAALCAVLGLLIWFAAGPPQYATAKPLIGIALLGLALILVLRSLLGADSLTEDLRAGKVESVEGALSKRVISARRSAASSYFFDVEHQRLQSTFCREVTGS